MKRRASVQEREKRANLANETIGLSSGPYKFTGKSCIYDGLINSPANYKNEFYKYPDLIFNDHGSLSDLSIIDNKTIILNFASAKRPGGGFLKGSKAQEEDLCLKSNLYRAISSKEVENFYLGENPSRDPMDGLFHYTEKSILSKNVLIFRDEYFNLLKNPVETNFITCAALNITGRIKTNTSMETYVKELIKTRVRSLFNAINTWNMFGEFDKLILGAWGCGVFNNPPKLVAEAFKEIIEETKPNVKKIYFNVKSGNSEIKEYFNRSFLKI